MKGKFKDEENMFKNIIEILTQKEVEKVKSVTMFYDEKREENMIITFICNNKEETFAVCPQYDE